MKIFFTGVFLTLGFSFAALIAMSPLVSHAGWPFNHDYLNWKFFTEIYALHFRRRDFFPLWAAEDAYGLGSCVPLLYHKLFFYVSGSMHALGSSIKTSIVTAIGFFSVVGAFGAYRLARYLGVSLAGGFAVGCAFLLQDYMVTDWLIRAAFSEFAACQFIPWLLLSSAVFLREQRIPRWTALVLILSFLSHSVIAYFAVLFWLGTFVAIRQSTLRRTLSEMATALVPFTIAVIPFLYLWRRVGPVFSVSALAEGDLHPNQNYRDFIGFYFWDRRWQWGATWEGLSSEFNLFTLGFLLVLLSLRRRGKLTAFRNGPFFRYVGFSLLAVVALQTPLGYPIYRWLPGAAYLQFPFRLLAFYQAFLIGLIALELGNLAPKWPRAYYAAILLLLLGSMATTKSLRPIRYGWFSAEALEKPLVSRSEIGALAGGEHRPNIAGLFDREQKEVILKKFAARGPELIASGNDCRARRQGNEFALEPASISIDVSCATPATLMVPVHFSGIETVRSFDGAGERKLRAYRTETDPRLRVDVAGTTKVTVYLPTWWTVIQ